MKTFLLMASIAKHHHPASVFGFINKHNRRLLLYSLYDVHTVGYRAAYNEGYDDGFKAAINYI